MTIQKIDHAYIKDWYIATGKVNNVLKVGTGKTHLEALINALK